MGLIFAYFGEGDPPQFPPYPGERPDAIVDLWNVENVPCNYLQCFENSMDETHVAFVQQPSTANGGSPITPAVTVQLLDQWGNRAASSATVTLAIRTNPSASRPRRGRTSSHTSGRTARTLGRAEPLAVSFGADDIVGH